ncbi:MAG: M48 family metallopeptidase [Actinobacteria bacterium]|nr:M48 family metallopeptidase [Actinomycetota bacterium]
MSTELSTITVSDLTVHVIHKPIKNLHVAVYPPDGLIRVSAPEHMDDDAVRLAVVDRLTWIREQRDELLAQPRQSVREMVTGESHYVWGRRYRLRVVTDGKASGVEIADRGTLVLTVPDGADRDERANILDEWRRRELKDALPALVTKWEEQLDVARVEWRVRRMRTRWGTCNPEARRIWLNLQLAQKPRPCLEYVILHEMLHLVEPGHTDRFERLLSEAMPDWRRRRSELSRLPLSDDGEWPPHDVPDRVVHSSPDGELAPPGE